MKTNEVTDSTPGEEIIESIPDPIGVINLEGKLQRVNKAFLDITGYDRDEIIGEDPLKFIALDDKTRLVNAWARCLNENCIRNLDINVVNKSGSEFPVLVNAELIYNTLGMPAKILNVFRVISDLKAAQEAVWRNQQTLLSFINSVTESAFLIDLNWKVLFCNEVSARRLGTTQEKLIHSVIWNFFEPGVAEFRKQKAREAIEKRGIITFEDERFGRIIENAINPVLDSEGNVISLAFFGNDITERKRAEEALRESEGDFKRLFEEHAAVKLIIDPETLSIFDVNIAASKYYGWPREEMRKMNMKQLSIFTPDEAERNIEKIRELGKMHFESKHRLADGSVRDVETFVNFIKMRGKEYLHSIVFDITDRKKNEEALRESERLYRMLFENMINGFAYCRVIPSETGAIEDFEYLNVNEAFERLTGLKNAIGRKVTEIIPGIRESNPELFEIYGRCAFSGNPEKFETFLPQLNSWLNVSVYCPEKGYFTAVFENITERKNSEEKIKALLREKELLLKEVHHRVKNNLSSVASLLSLQANETEDKTTVSALMDARRRVTSMGILYEKLSRSESLTEISAREYLTSLAEEIISLFPNKNIVRLETKIEDFLLSVKTLSSLGIMLNEILTNSMKYAFSDRNNGIISVSASHKDGIVSVEIGDDGAGISVDAAKGLGQDLIQMMAEQIGGTLRIEMENGTHYILEFSVLS